MKSDILRATSVGLVAAATIALEHVLSRKGTSREHDHSGRLKKFRHESVR
jgi:hypothetical protein